MILFFSPFKVLFKFMVLSLRWIFLNLENHVNITINLLRPLFLGVRSINSQNA